MKTCFNIAGAVILAIILVYSSANAAGPSRGGGPSGGGRGGGGGYPSGGSRSYGGGTYTGRTGGHWHHHGGYYGRGGWGWGFSFCWPWWGYYDYPYYYSPYDYYDYSVPPPVVYSAPVPSAPPTTPDTIQSPAQDYPLPPSSVYKDSAGNSLDKSSRQPPQPPAPAMSVADVKALVKSGFAEDTIINEIRASKVVFRLTTEQIIDLKQSGVSNKVIDFMINTAATQ